MEWLILPCMLFAHIIDDYGLQQSSLAILKQYAWWQKNAPDELYKNDYIIALAMHGCSWSFMIMFPAVLYAVFVIGSVNVAMVLALYLVNAFVHAFIDHVKANLRKINLIQDQLLHILQIAVTWICLCIAV